MHQSFFRFVIGRCDVVGNHSRDQIIRNLDGPFQHQGTGGRHRPRAAMNEPLCGFIAWLA